jgi:hypothetical protein
MFELPVRQATPDRPTRTVSSVPAFPGERRRATKITVSSREGWVRRNGVAVGYVHHMGFPTRPGALRGRLQQPRAGDRRPARLAQSQPGRASA